MRIFTSALLLVLFLNSYNSYSQINFEKELLAANPIKKSDSISANEKTAVLDDYLDKAIKNKNIPAQFYGHLYISADHLRKNDYEAATRQLFSADSIAEQSNNLSWQAAVHFRKGILFFEMNNVESALKDYLVALDCCRLEKDSAGIGANLKEVALVYHRLKKYDSAKHYFQMAIPLIRKFNDSNKLYAYYSNYSNLLKDMGDFAGAKLYLDSTMAIAMKGNDTYKQSSTKNNLAAFYVDMGEYDKAFRILDESIIVNKEHGWAELLSFNYANYSKAYGKLGNYYNAFKYLQDYDEIDDSLKSAEIKLKIAALNAIYEPQSKEVELEKQNKQLVSTRRSLERRNWGIAFGALIIVFGLLFWWFQKTKAKKQQLQSKNDLAELMRILIEKNSLLTALEEKLSTHEIKMTAAEHPLTEAASTETITEEEETFAEEQAILNDAAENHHKPNDFEKNFYNQRILTPEDWFSFKSYFEKAYPNYLFKLRNAYPTITEAEERLFLFIKLKLTNKEAASILGISPDSVKKTRNRLRKKLNLEEKIDLDEFVRAFNQ